MLARYILCDSPVLVRLSVRLGQRDRATPSHAEGPASRRDRSIHAAYCYRHTAVACSVHPCGLLLQTHSSSGVVSPSMRPIATDAQQWRGRSIHAAYCYRHTAVAWSVHSRGLLLQTHSSSGVVGPSMWPIATDAQQWRGRSIHAVYCYRRAAVAWSVHPCGLLLQTRSAVGALVEQPGGQRTGSALLF